jgi:hypothetical protein
MASELVSENPVLTNLQKCGTPKGEMIDFLKSMGWEQYGIRFVRNNDRCKIEIPSHYPDGWAQFDFWFANRYYCIIGIQEYKNMIQSEKNYLEVIYKRLNDEIEKF